MMPVVAHQYQSYERTGLFRRGDVPVPLIDDDLDVDVGA